MGQAQKEPFDMSEFNLESYLEHSKKVDVSDMDFADVPRYPLSEGEIRCLTYMHDIEAHTIVYLKGILSTCAIRDPRTTSFLSCWAYEEFFHGRTLGRFLDAYGVKLSPMRMAEVQMQASWRDWAGSIISPPASPATMSATGGRRPICCFAPWNRPMSTRRRR